MCAARARKWYDEQAKQRQTMSKGRGVKGQANLPDLKNESVGQSRDQVGKKFGVSGKSVDHATKVLEQGQPELIS
jgi:hypothetical protein